MSPFNKMIAAAALGAAVVVAPAHAFEAPGSAWHIDRIEIDIAPDAPLRLYNPKGANDENLDQRVSGVVRTGLQDAIAGTFTGERRTRMNVTVTRFEGISTAATLLIGGRMNGEMDIEIIDSQTGEVLAREEGMAFSRGVVSGIFTFGPMLIYGSSQDRKYADAVEEASSLWLESLSCADTDCTATE
ncbi:hypothetical protein KHP62_10220 [Rhodobacteraceae bacterium NNCM2]|nr:hypothetical protein [Coraliihabitans acroporae]